MPRFQPLSSSAQTSYAQALDAAQGAELSRSVANLPGTFARKRVKDHVYWYYQYTDLSGRRQQSYVGPESDRVQALIAACGAEHTAQDALRRLSASAVALGNAALLPKHFKVAQRLGDYGFFRAGGVLIGTHAFLAFGNMLGVRWRDGQRTQDIDFAHAGRSLSIALPADLQINVRDALESLELGLLPIQHGGAGSGATYLAPQDPEFQIDFLAPLHRSKEPYAHPMLGTMLQPLKFMEYLLEDVQQAALLAPRGVAVANVPHPARYAVHKLLVAGERPASQANKARKDVLQAAALFECYREHSPDSVEDALGDAFERGPGWRSRLESGLKLLHRAAPDLDVGEWLTIPKASASPQRSPGM